MLPENYGDFPSGKVPMFTIRAFCPYRGNVKAIVIVWSFADSERYEKKLKRALRNKIVKSIRMEWIDDIPF